MILQKLEEKWFCRKGHFNGNALYFYAWGYIPSNENTRFIYTYKKRENKVSKHTGKLP